MIRFMFRPINIKFNVAYLKFAKNAYGFKLQTYTQFSFGKFVLYLQGLNWILNVLCYVLCEFYYLILTVFKNHGQT